MKPNTNHDNSPSLESQSEETALTTLATNATTQDKPKFNSDDVKRLISVLQLPELSSAAHKRILSRF